MDGNVKERIEDTLFQLAAAMDIEKITVSQLVRECGISRTIFYYYFQDIYDVLECTISGRMEALVGQCTSIQDPQESVRHFVNGCVGELPLLRKVLRTKYYEDAERIISRISKKYFRLAFTSKAGNLPIHLSDVDFFVDFMAVAITAYFMENCEKMDFDADLISGQLYRMILSFTETQIC